MYKFIYFNSDSTVHRINAKKYQNHHVIYISYQSVKQLVRLISNMINFINEAHLHNLFYIIGSFAMPDSFSCCYTCQKINQQLVPRLHACSATSLYSPNNRCTGSCKPAFTEVRILNQY